MKRFLLPLMLIAQAALADAPVIWNGATAKWLPGGLQAAGLCKMSATGVQTVYTTDGLVKMSSGVPGAASSGTDFAPATSGSAILKGNGSGGFSSASAGTDYQAPISTSASVTHQFLTAWTAPDTFSRAQPAASDLSDGTTGSGAVCLASAPTLTNPIVGTQGSGDNSTKAASTAYVDAAVIAEGPAKDACAYATTSALATVVYANGSSGVGATLTAVAFGALSIDGNSPTVGQRLLVKDQASSLQNGIYVVTAVGNAGAVFVLTRATDFDQSIKVQSGSSTFIVNGTTNGGTVWDVNSATGPTMGTDAITFAQTAGPGSTTIGALDANAANAQGLSFSGSVLSAQSADATHPGVVNTTTQTFAGAKTFNSTIVGSISGNAGTATALAANPTDCSAGQFATAIDASGNLTCATPSSSGGGTSVLIKGATYQISASDFSAGANRLLLECNCQGTQPCNMTLPLSASNSGYEVKVINVGTVDCNVVTTAPDTFGSVPGDNMWRLLPGGSPQQGNTFTANGGTRWDGF